MLPSARIIQYGNDLSSVPVFALYDFLSTTDIVDRSPNKIPVSAYGSLPVGADSYGTYMNFTGQAQWVEFNSNLLNLGELDIYIKIANFTYRSGIYSNQIIDCRPAGTNGQYFVAGYSSNVPAPYTLWMYYQSAGELQSTNTFPDTSSKPIEMLFKIRNTGTQLFVDGSLFFSTTAAISMVNQQYKIGKNAWVNNGAPSAPYLYGKIYRFEIRRPT